MIFLLYQGSERGGPEALASEQRTGVSVAMRAPSGDGGRRGHGRLPGSQDRAGRERCVCVFLVSKRKVPRYLTISFDDQLFSGTMTCPLGGGTWFD